MGTFGFVVLHLIALFTFAGALFVTIPLHILYAVMSGGKSHEPTAETHVRCPACKELVHKEATICKHCRQSLVPESVRLERELQERRAARANKRWWQY